MPRNTRHPSRDLPRLALGAGSLFLGFALPATLPGCVDANNRLSVGAEPKEIRFEALNGAQPLAASDATPTDSAFQRPDDAPSVFSLDRTNWESRELAQPVDYTLHRPHYRVPSRVPNVLPRERGEFPTANTALDLSCRSDGQQAWQALGAPLGAFAEGLSIPFRLIMEPQSAVWRSPDLAYQRIPATVAAAEPIEPPPGAPPAPVIYKELPKELPPESRPESR
ncbi:MAG: hypothetical protein IT436_10470 [Phycisphaerales bacterium]|nr:hypothetical protein [Phycisphaerales bacterium]